MEVLRLADVDRDRLSVYLERYGLRLVVDGSGDIQGSYWGESEAGLVGRSVHVRLDTPVHSVLHESAHYVCMDSSRRARLYRDAGGDDLEESAVCYLQIVLSDRVNGFGRERAFSDMDAWGYSFRLGSTRAWFEEDAGDARRWLLRHGILDGGGAPTFRLRDDEAQGKR